MNPILTKIIEYSRELPFILIGSNRFGPKFQLCIFAKSKQQIIYNWLLGKFDKYKAISRGNWDIKLMLGYVRYKNPVEVEGDRYCYYWALKPIKIFEQEDWSKEQISQFIDWILTKDTNNLLPFYITEHYNEQLEDF